MDRFCVECGYTFEEGQEWCLSCAGETTEVVKDLKENLTTGRKPDITHVRRSFMTHCARGCEYGDKTLGGKYDRANYIRPAENVKVAFIRFREYLRAMISHGQLTLDDMESHQASDPHLEDEQGMIAACRKPDTDAKKNCPVGPSYLTHSCGWSASSMMAVEVGVRFGLLPEDPGQPWRKKK